MPTYQYACTECGEQLEKVQKFSDDPLTVCPNCSGRLRKVFSPVGIVFKGSGFYRTDSRAGSNGSLTGKDKDGKDGAGKDRADSGSKPDGKSETSSGDKSSAKSDSSSGSTSKDSGSSSSGSAGSSSGKSTGEKVA